MIRKWDREHPEKRKAIQRKYRSSDKGKIQTAKERIIYQKQIKARRLVNNMLRYHNIKDICAICGNNEVEVHHENYDEPFVIIWLCKEHHLEANNG